MSTFAVPFGNEREFLRPKPTGGSVKIHRKFIEKTERKVQASTGIVTKVVIQRYRAALIPKLRNESVGTAKHYMNIQ